jgi:hypothetical protein
MVRPEDRKTASEFACEANTAELLLGLECRKCGCRDFRVYYTRKASGKRIMRRRVCRHCGLMITTFEREV